MSEDKIDLTRLKLESETAEDMVRIYTEMGIYDPSKPLGHLCPIAELPCCDTMDEEDSAYQIARLFKAARNCLQPVRQSGIIGKRISPEP